jgi:pimeloyl-ACP methyl ester carboxylesterase
MDLIRATIMQSSLIMAISLCGAIPRAAADQIWQPVALPQQVPATEALAALPGTHLWYWDTGGTGAPIVLLHAATGSAAFWAYQQPVLAKAGYRVIGYSRRGYFKSDPGDKANPGFASEDLHHLLGYLGINRAHIVGVAAGGVAAVDFALSHADEVLSLTIAASTMGIEDTDYVALGNLIRPKLFAQLPPDFQELGPSYRAGNPAGAAAWLELEKQSVIGAERFDQPTVNTLSWANVENINAPTLLIGGEADLYTPPSILRLQASHLPGAEIVVVREAAHHPEWEQPDRFNQVLLDFLSRHTAP